MTWVAWAAWAAWACDACRLTRLGTSRCCVWLRLKRFLKGLSKGSPFLLPERDTAPTKQAFTGARWRESVQDYLSCGQEVAFNLRDIHMKKFLFAAALSAACGLAAAQGYAGAIASLTKINYEPGAGVSKDDSDVGFKVYGGYEVAPNIAVEVGYATFGKAKGTLGALNEEIKASAFSVVGAFRFPIAAEFTGVGRLGLASVSGKYSTNTPGVKNTSKSAIKLYSGLGLEYDIAKDIKLVGAFDLTSAEAEINGKSSSGTVFLFGAGLQAAY